jgi:pSer/pThr/pTyr-binding forkhead associated (FHA) protein
LNAVTDLIFVEQHPVTGRLVAFTDGATIGREGCDVLLPDPQASRRHAILRVAPEGPSVEDLGFHVLRDNLDRQRLVPLGGRDRLVVGRAADADLQVDWDEQVSRVHAEFAVIAGTWTISDDGLSRNGTYVNGERIHGRRRLVDGDGICLGRTLFMFCASAPARSGTTEMATRTVVPARLSDAQLRVLVALCRPYAGDLGRAAPATNREIADDLSLSIDAIKTQMRLLFDAFGLRDAPPAVKRIRLVELALSTGVVLTREL